ncbi:hypothetical protein SELMODRAFT_117403 [Selaginella moellendorffii]|uniref:Homoserine kinase n=1 Tax=Selaginella moellendorffii TaxID=88036 RepID=D8SIF2_SELML|nr:homoserine kinase [Selaginella moellendorffii]EFJ15959.1 hypothetical protein SELMODRAFT_117403 [Selaginella moellendorffii]|eukprot:XP_002983150.1 homoserine kinase [Selaginella moellendorffii]
MELSRVRHSSWIPDGESSFLSSKCDHKRFIRLRVKLVRCSTTLASSPGTLDLLSPLEQLTTAEPRPVLKLAKAFAPATVANLGPGYDFLGCAVQGLGDFVTAEVDEGVEPGKVRIKNITGDSGRLSYEPLKNCAGIAGKSTMELLGIKSVGLSLSLSKGLPLGSGLGSSAASAAAAAVAVNALFGSPLSKMELVYAGLKSEAVVSGYHADNIAPSLMGGFVLVRSYAPLHLIPLVFPSGKQLFFVLAIPEFEAPTKEMRKAVPQMIELKRHTANCSQAAALVAAILGGNAALLGEALASDTIVEPARSPMIPGMAAVKIQSMKQGAYGCTISGAGPTAVAVTDDESKTEAIGASMVLGFREHGNLRAGYSVHKLSKDGAKVVESLDF